MSESNPSAWGVDLNPKYQRHFDFERAVEDGWTDFFIKVSEGPWRNGKVLQIPKLKEFVHRAEAAGGRVGLYAYLVESFEDEGKSGRANAEHFLKRVDSVGGPDGRLILADFEAYSQKYGYLSPTNGNLEAFGEHVKARLDRDHPYMIYSDYGYWTGGKPSGSVERYGTKLTWDAQLAKDEFVSHPRSYYHNMEHWGWHSRVWGGVVPIYWQFTWKGHVGGLNVDCDACRLSPAEHRELWQRAGSGQPRHERKAKGSEAERLRHKRKGGGKEAERPRREQKASGKEAENTEKGSRMRTETGRLARVIRTLRDAAEQLEKLDGDDRDAPDGKPDKPRDNTHQDGGHPDRSRVPAARVIDEYFEGHYGNYGEYEGFGDLIVRKAEHSGLELPLACALVEKESGGRNIIFCDEGPYCHEQVTQARVKRIVDDEFRLGTQGIGLTQLTGSEYVEKAENLGGAHLPANQLQVGFELMADYLEEYPLKEALGAYNAGPDDRGLGIEKGYAADVVAKREAWEHRLEDVHSQDHDEAHHDGPDHDRPDHDRPDRDRPDHDKPDHEKPDHDGPDSSEQNVYRVRVGPFDTEREANEFADEAEDMAPGTRAVLLKPRDVDGGHKPNRPRHERPDHDRPDHEKPDHDRPHHERPHHERPHEPDLVSRARKAANFGREHLLGIEYGNGWEPGTWPPGPPLYSHCDPEKHTLRYIRNHDMICSALINILRAYVFDLPAIGRAQGDAYPGGTAAIGRTWARMKGSRPYLPHHQVPDFWVLYSPYQGTERNLQGHVGIKLPGNKVLEAHPPHSSDNRGVKEVDRLMKNLCGIGWTNIIPPEIWTRK